MYGMICTNQTRIRLDAVGKWPQSGCSTEQLKDIYETHDMCCWTLWGVVKSHLTQV